MRASLEYSLFNTLSIAPKFDSAASAAFLMQVSVKHLLIFSDAAEGIVKRWAIKIPRVGMAFKVLWCIFLLGIAVFISAGVIKIFA